MVGARMSRRARRFFKRIQRADSKFGLQEIASAIQTDLDKRHLSYDEALMLGNLIQNRADQVPGDTILYAISDRDAYRRTLSCTSGTPSSLERSSCFSGKSDVVLESRTVNTKPCSTNFSLSGSDKANPSPSTGSKSPAEVLILHKKALPFALVALLLVTSLAPLASGTQGRSTPDFVISSFTLDNAG